MEWLVLKSLYLRGPRQYAVVLQSNGLNMLCLAMSSYPLEEGDVIYPVRDALYLINKDERKLVRVTQASKFTEHQWKLTKKFCVFCGD